MQSVYGKMQSNSIKCNRLRVYGENISPEKVPRIFLNFEKIANPQKKPLYIFYGFFHYNLRHSIRDVMTIVRRL